MHQNAERNKARIERRERTLPEQPLEKQDALLEINKLKLLYNHEFKKTAVALGEDFARAEPKFREAIERTRDAAHAAGMHEWHGSGLKGFTKEYRQRRRANNAKRDLMRTFEYVPGKGVLIELLGHPHFFHALTRPR